MGDGLSVHGIRVGLPAGGGGRELHQLGHVAGVVRTNAVPDQYGVDWRAGAEQLPGGLEDQAVRVHQEVLFPDDGQDGGDVFRGDQRRR